MSEKMVIRRLDTRVEKGPAPRSFDFIVSNGREDRDGDIVNPDGWDLTSYRKSPVILWAHDHRTPPIARATSIGVSGGALRATAEFPPRGIYPFADQIHDLVGGGFIRASSVGFIPLERSKTGYARQELTEFSLVSVPSNPDALVQLRSWLGQGRSAATDEIVLELVKSPGGHFSLLDRPLVGRRGAETFDVDLDAVERGVREALKRGLHAVVAREMRDAMTALTGRLD